MRLASLYAAGYRSLRAIRLDIGRVGLFVGENGAGKSNLYRALQLVKASASGELALEIAREGGMQSALWSGVRSAGKPVRIVLEAGFEAEDGVGPQSYRVEIGLPPPTSAGFTLEPHVKEELLTAELGRPAVELMRRKSAQVSARDGEGRRTEHPVRLLNAETALAALGGSGLYPEIGRLRATLLNWRFFHGFRSDVDSPLRRPALAVTAPMLDEDGRNLAAVLATLVHIREDTTELDRCVADALNGASLEVPPPGEAATFGLRTREFPQRIFRPEELSDGQIRFLALAAALLSYRPPSLIALNEPETSLHPSMLPALAELIATAATRTQIWIVTHSTELARLVADRTGARSLTVVRRDGATTIAGLRLDGSLADGDE